MLTLFERDMLRFLGAHLAYGTCGGFIFGILLLWYDVAGLGTLIFTSSVTGLALVMLFFGLFVTFGSIGMAVGVMTLGREHD